MQVAFGRRETRQDRARRCETRCRSLGRNSPIRRTVDGKERSAMQWGPPEWAESLSIV
jgi:hypothetical protein